MLVILTHEPHTTSILRKLAIIAPGALGPSFPPTDTMSPHQCAVHFGCVSTWAVYRSLHVQHEFSSISSSKRRFFHFESEDDCSWFLCACVKLCFTPIWRCRSVLKRNRHHHVRLVKIKLINQLFCGVDPAYAGSGNFSLTN